MAKKRNMDYENKFRAYLYSGDIERFGEICKNINVTKRLLENIEKSKKKTGKVM